MGKVSPSPARVDGCLTRVGVTGWRPSSRCTRISTTRWIPRWSPTAPARNWSAASRRPMSAAAMAFPQDRLVVVNSGEPIRLGAYDVTLVESRPQPTRPVSRRDRSAGRAAGEGSGLPVRRGMVDADTPPAVGPAAADPGQRRVREGLADRPARRRRLSRCRANSVCNRSRISSTTGRRPCGPWARAGWFSFTGTTSSARCQSRCGPCPMSADDLDVSMRVLTQAGRAGRCRAAHADGVAARRPVGLSLTLILALLSLAAVLAFAVARPRGWPEAFAAVPAVVLLIAVGAISMHDRGRRSRARLSPSSHSWAQCWCWPSCVTTKACSRPPVRRWRGTRRFTTACCGRCSSSPPSSPRR